MGYSFNLDGSMMYCTFATLFMAQAYGIELNIATQITMLLILMVTSTQQVDLNRPSSSEPARRTIVLAKMRPIDGESPMCAMPTTSVDSTSEAMIILISAAGTGWKFPGPRSLRSTLRAIMLP
jgi:hypothetical protein